MERNTPLLLILKMPKVTINGLTMPNLMTLFNFASQSQKQMSLLNSLLNFEKNEYKLDYVLNRFLKTPFACITRLWVSYMKIWTKTFHK
jgi:hypothetical protein